MWEFAICDLRFAICDWKRSADDTDVECNHRGTQRCTEYGVTEKVRKDGMGTGRVPDGSAVVLGKWGWEARRHESTDAGQMKKFIEELEKDGNTAKNTWQDWAGWPREVTRPGLPQIRTCAIDAYGSSSHGFAACIYCHAPC